VVKDIHKMVPIQHHEHDAALATDEMRVAIDLQIPEFARLQQKITHQGLRELKEQLDMARSDEYNTAQKCTGAFTKKNGLPCKHTLYAQLEEAQSQSRVFAISVLEVHQHWWFWPPRASKTEVQEERYILDPAKVKPKGRPVGSTRVTLPKKTPTQASQAIRGRNPHRSRRDKSGWEHVQAAYNVSAASQDTSTTTQDDQQAPELEPEVLRRSQRTRIPTQKVINMQDKVDEGPIELSSGSEHDLEDDSEASDGIEEVEEFTVVCRNVT
jgi:hypothetical protein